MSAYEENLNVGVDDIHFQYGRTSDGSEIDIESGFPNGGNLAPFFIGLSDGKPGDIFIGASRNHLQSEAERLPPPRESFIERAWKWVKNSVWRSLFASVNPPEPTVVVEPENDAKVIAACSTIESSDDSLYNAVAGDKNELAAKDIAKHSNGKLLRDKVLVFTWPSWKAKHGLVGEHSIEWDELVDAINGGGVFVCSGGSLVADPFKDLLGGDEGEEEEGGDEVRPVIIDVGWYPLGSITRLPSHGIAADNEDGTVTYTPNHGYGGLDSFECEVSSRIESSSATITVSLLVVAKDKERSRMALLKEEADEAARLLKQCRPCKGKIIATDKEGNVLQKYPSISQATDTKETFVGSHIFPECGSLWGGCKCRGSKSCKRRLRVDDIKKAAGERLKCMVTRKAKDESIEEIWIEYYSFEKFGMEYEDIVESHPNRNL